MRVIEIYRKFFFVLKYLRLSLFQTALRPVQAALRKRRMNAFMSHMKVQENTTILDLGGRPMIWDSVYTRLNITILNLPGGGADSNHVSHHSILYVDGDGCNVVAYVDQAFDIVFSNSVIEHVGDHEKQVQFAAEVKRLGRSYWVQTPSKYFPLEAHSGMPFWWFYPERLRQYFIAGWRRKLPDWTEMIEGTRVLDLNQLQRLFPGSEIKTERLLGIPKSYIAYHVS